MSVKTVQRLTELFNRTGSVSPVAQRHGPLRKVSELDDITILICFLANLEVYPDEVQEDLFDKTGKWEQVYSLP